MENKKINFVEFKSVLFDIILTIITLGLFNLWVQIRQLHDINTIIGENKYSFTIVLIFCIFTFGIYFIYHEYKITKELHLLIYKERYHLVEFLMIPLTACGLWFFVDSYQQGLINKFSKSD
tara:strand:- start:98 stop:460 length:363 start_codon:yes stop_codon:yes gene_type:complete